MKTGQSPLIVVGAGQAGGALVAKLRAIGYRGDLVLVGEEAVPPYQRPPLSKAYLLGDMDQERLFLRPAKFYDELDVELRLGRRVDHIDPISQSIKVGDETFEYHQLALTTGSVANRLPQQIGGHLDGVYTVRSLADVDAMADEFRPDQNLLIVGGGYIGLEAAAVASKLGLKVTLVEMSERILQRVASKETSDYFRQLHESHGVKIVEGVGLERLTGEGRLAGAVLTDGQTLPADFVIAGIGISPATALAQAAGLRIENGIWTDETGRTSDPSIWAAGDCASFPWKGEQRRLESVGHAIDHAECVAQNMVGGSLSYAPKPWFWSDQYDVKLQIAGLNVGYDRVVTRRGENGAVSFWYYAEDRLLAVDSVNDPRAYMAGKRIIDAGKSVPADCATDTAIQLKDLMAMAQ